MKTRQLLRKDLPYRRISQHSLHVPVIFDGIKKYVCDIHFGDIELCYLEDNNGIPVRINKLLLITDQRSNEDIQNEIILKQQKIEQFSEKIGQLRRDIARLKYELKSR